MLRTLRLQDVVYLLEGEAPAMFPRTAVGVGVAAAEGLVLSESGDADTQVLCTACTIQCRAPPALLLRRPGWHLLHPLAVAGWLAEAGRQWGLTQMHRCVTWECFSPLPTHPR